MKTDAVIFDLDDTLVAFDLVTESTWRQVCLEYVSGNRSVSFDAVFNAVTAESREFWSDEERHKTGRLDIVSARRSVVSSAFSKLGLPDGDALVLADRYSAQRLNNMYLMPGAEETLSVLRGRQIKLAMITNGDLEIQRYKIDRFGLEKFFGYIMIEGEVGYGKPDKRIFETAILRLGVAPERAVMVGDNLEWDVGGPQAVGINGIWFDVRRSGLPPDTHVVPAAIITSLDQLPGFLG